MTWLIILFIGVFVFITIYIIMHKGLNGLFYGKLTNATLTCKKGHKCRVWVNYRGDGWWYDFEKGGEAYHVGGRPAIIPDTCPECGAHWVVPHKHKEHDKAMTLEHHHK